MNRFSITNRFCNQRVMFAVITCILISLFLVTQWCFGPYREFTTKRLLVVFVHYFTMSSIWAMLAVAIRPVVARLGFDRQKTLRTTLLYLLIGIGFSLVFYVLARFPAQLIGYVSYGIPFKSEISWFEFLASMNANLVVFALIVGMFGAVGYVQKQRTHELLTAKLENQLAQANLNTLKYQLQPHFLFNSLNTVASLVRENSRAAEEMIVQLGELLRYTLEKVKQNEVPLIDELRFISNYLEIEKMRFGDRLVVENRVDIDCSDAMVPTLILQPLVENAIRHGVARMSKPSTIILSAKKIDSRLCFSVADTGPGRKEQKQHATGIGLENTSERLRIHYGDHFVMRANNRADRDGFCVSIQIPLRYVENEEKVN